MKLNYHKWATIQIDNEYFSNGEYSGFNLVPTSDTLRKMNNYHVKVQKQGNLFTMYLGMANDEPFVIAEAFKNLDYLDFQITVADYEFFNYTVVTNTEAQVFCFQNTNGTSLSQSDEGVVSENDLVSIAVKNLTIQLPEKQVTFQLKDYSGDVLFSKDVDGQLNKNYSIALEGYEDGLHTLDIDGQEQKLYIATSGLEDNGLGFINIDIQQVVSQFKEPINYQLQFNVKSVFWQYQIVVPSNRKIQVLEMEVLDADTKPFSGPEQKTIVGGQEAKIFTSSSPKELQNSLENPPSLNIIYSNDFSNRKNELEIKLPNFETDQIVKLDEGGNSSFIATRIVYV